nr:cation:proton antiporter [Desulfurispira natronophila]
MLFFVAGALAVPSVSRRLGLPNAVGEIIFGVILGYMFSVHLVLNTEVVSFLATFGFIVLMYMAGLEIDLEDLKTMPRREIIVIHSYFVALVGVAVVVTWLLNQPPFFILLYCTMAIGLLYPVLREMNLLQRDLGKNLLIIASMGEIYVLLALTFFVIQYDYGITAEALLRISYVLFFSFAAYLFLRLLQLLLWWYPSLASLFLHTGNLNESGVRSNFVIMLAFVSLAILLGIEPIVGAFIGGILFSAVFKEKESIRGSFSVLGNGFLIPIFFIYVGYQFDLGLLLHPEFVINALVFSLAFLLIRLVAVFPFAFSRRSWREVLMVPVATAYPLTLLVAFGQVGLSLNIIDERTASSVVLAAMICALVYPSIMRFMSQRLVVSEARNGNDSVSRER